MKKFFTLFISILTSVVLYSQETNLPQAADSTAAAPKLSQEEMVIALQKQMTEIQLKLDQIQYSLSDSAKAKKDIIPVVADPAKSRFYWSIRANFMLASEQYVESTDPKQKPDTKVSYALKPAFGYIFNDRLTVGTTLVFADCRFANLTTNSLQYIIANAMIGGGFSLTDYITWSVQPYVRYRICHLIWPKLNLWGEFTAYAGQKIPRDINTHKLQPSNTSTIYGVKLRPMLTVDLNKDIMLFSAMELISWDGACKTENGAVLTNNQFTVNIIPIYSILSGLFNIGIIKRF